MGKKSADISDYQPIRKLSDSLSKKSLKEIEDFDSLSDLEEDEEKEDSQTSESEEFVINVLTSDEISKSNKVQIGRVYMRY